MAVTLNLIKRGVQNLKHCDYFLRLRIDSCSQMWIIVKYDPVYGTQSREVSKIVSQSFLKNVKRQTDQTDDKNKTSQELRMLSSVTLNCQETKTVMN